MMRRLLCLLALALPLAACAAQGPAGQGTPDTHPAAVQTVPAATPAAAPAAVPSTAATHDHDAAIPAPTGPARARAQGGQGATVSTAAASTSSATRPATTPADVAAPNPAAAGNAAVGATSPAPGPAANPAAAPNPVPIPNTGPVAMPSGSPTGSLLRTLFALIVVLGVLAALAWFLKRYGPRAGGANANVKVVGSLNLGGRERLLVVEVGNQWIVVGASPGRVNGLATMPKQEGVDATATLVTPGPSANSFADWLRQTIDKRK